MLPSLRNNGHRVGNRRRRRGRSRPRHRHVPHADSAADGCRWPCPSIIAGIRTARLDGGAGDAFHPGRGPSLGNYIFTGLRRASVAVPRAASPPGHGGRLDTQLWRVLWLVEKRFAANPQRRKFAGRTERVLSSRPCCWQRRITPYSLLRSRERISRSRQGSTEQHIHRRPAGAGMEDAGFRVDTPGPRHPGNLRGHGQRRCRRLFSNIASPYGRIS